MPKTLKNLLSDQSGTTAIEYAFIASIVSLSIITGMLLIRTYVNGSFTNVSNGFK